MSSTIAAEHCANCGDVIGKLETPHVWRDSVVCSRCFQKLAGAAPAQPGQTVGQAPVARPSGDVVKTTDQVAGRVLLIVAALVFALICIAAVVSAFNNR